MPTWTENFADPGNSTEGSSNTFNNAFKNGGTYNMASSIKYSGVGNQGLVYYQKITDKALSVLTTANHYKDIAITLTYAAETNKIQFYLKPNGSGDTYYIYEWGTGKTAGKIIADGASAMRIVLSKTWMHENLLNGKTYQITLYGTSAGSPVSCNLKTEGNDNGWGTGMTTVFGGTDKDTPTGYSPSGSYTTSVFPASAPNRPWHDGTADVTWP